MKRILTALFMAAALAVPVFAVPGTASAQVYVNISVGYAPPPIPWYPQPICPDVGYLWTPGYWAYGPYGYYWVPGTWVLAPAVGLFWTPGFWAWDGGYYWWHAGYWGPTVGFYGGINYGYGYSGYGYWGGYWRGGSFYYNRAITNVNVTYIHNTYNQPVSNANVNASRVSYNGGQGGIGLRPTPEQQQYARQQHVAPTAMQLHQERVALDDPQQRFAVNQGRPQVAATARPGMFTGTDVVRMNSERSGYVYRDVARPLPPTFKNGARGEREPQVQPARPYVNEYRPPVPTAENRYAAPVHEANPRPIPPPATREHEQRPQPPRMNFSNPYASAEQPPVRAEAGGWNMQMPRPERSQSAPIQQDSRSAPRLQAPAPSRSSDERSRENHVKPPR